MYNFRNSYLSLVVLSIKKKFFLNTYSKLGITLDTENTPVNKFLPSQNLHSSIEYRLDVSAYIFKNPCLREQ